jgi:hypothetical protein
MTLPPECAAGKVLPGLKSYLRLTLHSRIWIRGTVVVKVILPRTCRYPTDVNTTSAGGDGGASAPASAKSASRTAVVAIVVPVAQEYHRAQGEARVGQRGTENSRDYNRSQTLEKESAGPRWSVWKPVRTCAGLAALHTSGRPLLTCVVGRRALRPWPWLQVVRVMTLDSIEP